MRILGPSVWVSCFLFVLVLTGCGGGDDPAAQNGEGDGPNTTSGSGGKGNSAAGDWPKLEPLPPIEYTAVDRPAPQSIEEAKATLEEIRKFFNTSNVPDPIQNPITREAVYEIAKGVKLLQTQLPSDVAWINSVEGTKIPGADRFSAQTLDDEAEWLKKRDEFRQVVARYREKLAKAADAISPPQDVGDPALTRIAEEVLSRPGHGLPPHVRLIVTTRRKNGAKDHYSVDYGERSVTKSPYRWEEFQVATVEQDGDRHFLWYNTLLKYSVGPHTVPTGKWVLGPRHKSSPISTANINK